MAHVGSFCGLPITYVIQTLKNIRIVSGTCKLERNWYSQHQSYRTVGW